MLEQTKASLKLIQAQRDLEVLNETSERRAEEFNKAQEDADEAMRNKNDLRQKALEVHDKVSKALHPGESSSEESEAVAEATEWMNTRGGEVPDAEELEEELSGLETRLNMTHSGNEGIVRQYEARKVQVGLFFLFYVYSFLSLVISAL
jgi:chromosome segregation ATPase